MREDAPQPPPPSVPPPGPEPGAETVVEERRFPPGGGLWPWLLLVALVALGLVIGAIALGAADDGEDEAVTLAATPDVLGLQAEEAVARLEEVGLRARVAATASDEPAGTVVGQEPPAGTEVEQGAEVVLAVAGEEETTVTVEEEETVTVDEEATTAIPNVTFVDHVDAGAQLERDGLVADSLPVESNHPRGTVIAVEPAPGTAVAEGTHVRLSVSIGPEERPSAAVPDVTGLGGSDARATLREAGFTVRTVEETVEDGEAGTVVAQEPAAGAETPVLNRVTIHVAR